MHTMHECLERILERKPNRITPKIPPQILTSGRDVKAWRVWNMVLQPMPDSKNKFIRN